MSVKRDPDITGRKEGELGQLRADYEACREIMTLRDHPGWNRIREIIKANLVQLVGQRSEFQKITENGLRFILKEEQDFEFFLDLVDKVDERMEMLGEKISLATNELNERKRPAPPHASQTPGV
jgi:hypothetical protein